MPDNGPRVVVDTTALQYLFQIRSLDLLAALYGQVVVPAAVAGELEVGRTQGVSLPDPHQYGWMQVREIDTSALSEGADDLGAGERQVLSAVSQEPGLLAVLDDGAARAYAEANGLHYTGTLGVLVQAKAMGLVPLVAPLLDQLQAAGFWLSAAARVHVLRRAGE